MHLRRRENSIMSSVSDELNRLVKIRDEEKRKRDKDDVFAEKKKENRIMNTNSFFVKIGCEARR